MTVRIPPPLDDFARRIVARSPNMLAPWWLMASYVYYHADGALVTDAFYDEMCCDLLARWEQVRHPHKHLIERGALLSGTGYYLSEEAYPARVVATAALLMRKGALEEYLPPAPEPEPQAPLMSRAFETEPAAPAAKPAAAPVQGELF